MDAEKVKGKTIRDRFQIGDEVEWITIKRSGGTIEIKKHRGTITEFRGSKAMIRIPGRAYRKRMSLYELEVIRRDGQPYNKDEEVNEQETATAG
jgi:dsDNA-specific endonuclease/ATPase MutS2